MAQAAPPVDETLLKGYDPQVVRRLAVFFRPYTAELLLSLVLMLFNSAAAVAGPASTRARRRRSPTPTSSTPGAASRT
jgi:hypothetical protein